MWEGRTKAADEAPANLSSELTDSNYTQLTDLYNKHKDQEKWMINWLKSSISIQKVCCYPIYSFNEADDGSLWDSSDEELDKTSDLDREWQRRHDRFHTIGYRDGLIAGKEASAQEGFNIGFKQSVPIGYNWGITRGVTSALACVPDDSRERLIETQEKRDKFWELYGCVNSVSASNALELFHDDILTKKAGVEQSSNPASLGRYTAKLQSLILDSPEIQVQFFHQDVSN
ncbi:hypothetical protein V6N13_068326 [Hibiscus sabdariffa]|uniref:Essential protein Yae1 N-terminal domain-containing protein n=1 Tax=Hibiscus sabdariffa TaxID=183260 RepID=A0ABR2QMA4_9ROSI